MKILILGYDGYIGWPLTLHLLNKGYEVAVLDSFVRRYRVKNLGFKSLTPILPTAKRRDFLEKFPNFINENMNVRLYVRPNIIRSVLHLINPDVIVHLAEQPSAPYSMMSAELASETQFQNTIGTLYLLWAMKEKCPNAHLIKIGTMGEYGTPNCNIPEGKIPKVPCHWILTKEIPEGIAVGNIINLDPKCPMSGLQFPKTAGSFYHLSKVFDSQNIEFACRNWKLRSTDIMQGVVFGLNDVEDETLLTRFDYDECFGTVINRFCTQAIINHPLTIYGEGNQARGFLTLDDSIKCLTIAIENPPSEGEYRVLNQFENVYSINNLANMVAAESNSNLKLEHIKNPRNESEDHYYNPIHQKLFDLGYVPNCDIQKEIGKLIKVILPYKNEVIREAIMPRIKWS